MSFSQSQNILTTFSISNIDEYTDAELTEYYEEATKQGYSLDQLKAIAKARGVSPSKINEFEERLEVFSARGESVVGIKNNPLAIRQEDANSEQTISFQDDNLSPIFGMDFFSNKNLNFAPNLNLSTPENYILGPGDELVINVWGAAERIYNVAVDREGAIRIPNIGPIFLSGNSIVEAEGKIKSSLKRIYSGIGSSTSSPYKTNVDISLSGIRTVKVNVIGEAKNPGTYDVSSLSTVINVLYLSGGPSSNGTLRNIEIIRRGKVIETFDLYQFLVNGISNSSITVQEQDIILIKPYLSRVTLSGATKRTGVFELKENESFNELLDFSGGFKSDAFRDKFILERIDGDGKVLKEINYPELSNIILNDGDNIVIKNVLNEFKNKVEIEGAVNRPGIYEFDEGLTVLDLINRANGLKDEAFLNRGLVLRNLNDKGTEAINFTLDSILDNEKEVLLRKDDVVKIYSTNSLTVKEYISISGAVNNPIELEYINNISIEDLVVMAGGLKQGADPNKVDIYRRIDDNDLETLSESIETKVAIDLRDSNVRLLPNDRVSIRFKKGFSEQIYVNVLGQINYPGNYALDSKSQRISDIIQKSGGLTDYAFAKGATLKRKNPYFKENSQNEVIVDIAQKVNNDEGKTDLYNPEFLRVGIDLEAILANPDHKSNLLLNNGDELDIPSLKETVKVEGAVLVPSLVRFDKLYNLKDYVNNSGGWSNEAKKAKSYVVYLSGEIAATKSFLFFKLYPKLEPGALIIVPKKPEKKSSISTQEVIALSSGVASFALLIDRLFTN